MPSETERITHDFMDKHYFERLAERLGGKNPSRPDGHIRAEDDPQFTNEAYMKLERPPRDGHH